MNNLEESNKNLISLRTNLITIILVLTSGIMGLFYSDIIWLHKIVPLILGVYLDTVFIVNVTQVNKLLDKNIGGK